MEPEGLGGKEKIVIKGQEWSFRAGVISIPKVSLISRKPYAHH